MTDTTIALSERTKRLLDKEQLEGETYDGTVLRLLDAQEGQLWTETELEFLIERKLREMQR